MKKLIFVALLGVIAGMMLYTPMAKATTGLVVYAQNIASRAVTAAKIQGGAVNTIPMTGADGGVTYVAVAGDISGAPNATAIGARKVLPAMLQGGAVNYVPMSGADGGVTYSAIGNGMINHGVCWKTATTEGFCSTPMSVDGGTCTCN